MSDFSIQIYNFIDSIFLIIIIYIIVYYLVELLDNANDIHNEMKKKVNYFYSCNL